jgi:hypothetical protein
MQRFGWMCRPSPQHARFSRSILADPRTCCRSAARFSESEEILTFLSSLFKISVYPALGNHDLHGDPTLTLGNYFQRFPELKNSRYYSVRAANTLLLVLDSSLAETDGPQGTWLAAKLDGVLSDVDFVFVMDHHPPYTSFSDPKLFGGGHSARTSERELAKFLEARQAQARFRIIMFSGHVHNYERHCLRRRRGARLSD